MPTRPAAGKSLFSSALSRAEAALRYPCRTLDDRRCTSNAPSGPKWSGSPHGERPSRLSAVHRSKRSGRAADFLQNPSDAERPPRPGDSRGEVVSRAVLTGAGWRRSDGGDVRRTGTIGCFGSEGVREAAARSREARVHHVVEDRPERIGEPDAGTATRNRWRAGAGASGSRHPSHRGAAGRSGRGSASCRCRSGERTRGTDGCRFRRTARAGAGRAGRGTARTPG